VGANIRDSQVEIRNPQFEIRNSQFEIRNSQFVSVSTHGSWLFIIRRPVNGWRSRPTCLTK
jgi:hypothetical protein